MANQSAPDEHSINLDDTFSLKDWVHDVKFKKLKSIWVSELQIFKPGSSVLRRLYLKHLLHVLTSGIDPIKILQHKFYAALFFKHSDWLKNVNSKSKCLKK